MFLCPAHALRFERGARRIPSALLGCAGLGLLTAAGVALAWPSSRALGGLLYGSGSAGPVLLAMAALGLGAVALAGSYVPSRRAASVNPLSTLRHD